LGDVIYSFGEAQYYYDQFYDPYRNYPVPIFAIAGNHDGMVPNSSVESLAAFVENFCQAGNPPHRTPESGELARTAQVQPGVYYTLEAPLFECSRCTATASRIQALSRRGTGSFLTLPIRSWSFSPRRWLG
jgi:hypothetical protein